LADVFFGFCFFEILWDWLMPPVNPSKSLINGQFGTLADGLILWDWLIPPVNPSESLINWQFGTLADVFFGFFKMLWHWLIPPVDPSKLFCLVTPCGVWGLFCLLMGLLRDFCFCSVDTTMESSKEDVLESLVLWSMGL